MPGPGWEGGSGGGPGQPWDVWVPQSRLENAGTSRFLSLTEGLRRYALSETLSYLFNRLRAAET